jgi:hypothetical protein
MPTKTIPQIQFTGTAEACQEEAARLAREERTEFCVLQTKKDGGFLVYCFAEFDGMRQE